MWGGERKKPYPVILCFLFRIFQSLQSPSTIKWNTFITLNQPTPNEQGKIKLGRVKMTTDLIRLSYLLKFSLGRRIILIGIGMVLLSELQKNAYTEPKMHKVIAMHIVLKAKRNSKYPHNAKAPQLLTA